MNGWSKAVCRSKLAMFWLSEARISGNYKRDVTGRLENIGALAQIFLAKLPD